MSSQKLVRTAYQDPNSPQNPVRIGSPTLAESDLNMNQYERPLEQVHGSSLHGWGVASGLRVTATIGSPDINVLPGVAIDISGRHISLAQGGKAEVHRNVGDPSILADVTATGVVIHTAALTPGDKYVTVQFWETFDWDAYNDPKVLVHFQTLHTPWIQLLDATTFTNDGTAIVLGKVTLDAGAKVTALSQGLRQGTNLPTQSIHLRKGTTTSPAPNIAIDNTDAGTISARATGGIDLTVPNATDEIHLVGTHRIVAERSDGIEAIVLDAPNANLRVGGGVAGTVVVRDHHNHPTITLEGSEANIRAGTAGNSGSVLVDNGRGEVSVMLDGIESAITVGATRSPGSFRTLDSEGQTTIYMNGQTGDITFKGNLLGKHGDATGAISVWLSARDNGIASHDINNLPVGRRLFALIVLTSILHSHPGGGKDGTASIAYIDSIDGQALNPHSLNPTSAWAGYAQSIRFKLVSNLGSDAWALAIVFTQ